MQDQPTTHERRSVERRSRRQFISMWPPALAGAALCLVGCGGASESPSAPSDGASTPASTPTTPPTPAAPTPLPGVFNGKFAFHRPGGASGTTDIFTTELDGSNEVRVMARGAGPKWSPDGTRILFLSTRDAASNRVYVMNADGSEPRRVTAGTAVESEPRWHPDGKRIVFSASGSIHIIGADGTGQAKLIDAAGASYGGPAFSPDGTKLAYTSVGGGVSAIFVATADGANPVRLSGPEDNDSQPTWSPDGKRLAFTNRGAVKFNIFTINPDGSDRRRVTQDSDLVQSQATWAPDGTRLAFNRFPQVANPAFVDIVSVSPAGTDEQVVTQPAGTRWCAFVDWQRKPA